MTTIEKLAEFGQSVWLDNINRALIESGKLKKLLAIGLRGLTSNPSIFEKAISAAPDYDNLIQRLSAQGKTVFEIYHELTIKDIQDVADIFYPLYQDTGGLDGRVSLEVDPRLAFKAQETIAEGIRLSKKVNRPNLLLKVPATEEGFVAVEELLSRGLNVNVTLIFSKEQYINTANAYLRGVSRYLKNNGDVKCLRSVASVFVSRIDTFVDDLLDKKIKETEAKNKEKLLILKGLAAVSYDKLIYEEFLKIFNSPEFKELSKLGANSQRVLWASTGTKNSAYSDIKYVTELIGKDTVNTMPENTLEAFLDHGRVRAVLTLGNSEARENIAALKKSFGIDMDEVCAQLLNDGLKAFVNSFELLLSAIEKKAGKNSRVLV